MSGGLVRSLLLLFLAAASEPGAAGAPAYLDAPAISGYDLLPAGFTVEFWVRTESKPGFDPRIIHCVNADPGPAAYEGSAQWALFICNLSDCAPGTVLFEVGSHGESHYIASTLRVDDGGFHHVAGTYDGKALRLLVDGTVQAESPLIGFQVHVGGGRIVIGNAADHRNAFDGMVDELRIWRTARSAEEIRSSMEAGYGKAPPGVTGYWPLDGDGADRSGNDNPLHPHNAVVFPEGRLGRGADVVNADPVKG